MARHLHARHLMARFRTHRAHVIFDVHRAGLFEHQRSLEMIARGERFLLTNEHDVERAGLEFYTVIVCRASQMPWMLQNV